jgi:hypothetical protein
MARIAVMSTVIGLAIGFLTARSAGPLADLHGSVPSIVAVGCLRVLAVMAVFGAVFFSAEAESSRLRLAAATAVVVAGATAIFIWIVTDGLLAALT